MKRPPSYQPFPAGVCVRRRRFPLLPIGRGPDLESLRRFVCACGCGRSWRANRECQQRYASRRCEVETEGDVIRAREQARRGVGMAQYKRFNARVLELSGKKKTLKQITETLVTEGIPAPSGCRATLSAVRNHLARAKGKIKARAEADARKARAKKRKE